MVKCEVQGGGLGGDKSLGDTDLALLVLRLEEMPRE